MRISFKNKSKTVDLRCVKILENVRPGFEQGYYEYVGFR